MNSRSKSKVSAESETGAVAVITAIMLFVLLLFVGLGVDVSAWYFEGHRQQVAADQAAVAAAIFLPDNPGAAEAQAIETAGANGYTPDQISVKVGTGQKANQIKVTIETKNPTYFSRLAGKTEQEITRFATAEWVPPVPIGSPNALLGNDPESTDPSGNFWLAQMGPWAYKHNGDRFAADDCTPDPSVAFPVPYNCPSGPGRGVSPDYTNVGKDGYRYRLDVNTVVPNRELVIEAFDPILANTGDLCTNGFPAPADLARLTPYVPDAPTRYVGGVGPWCLPNNLNAGGDAARNTIPTETEFTVLGPTRGSVATISEPTAPTPTSSGPMGPLGGGVLTAPCPAPGATGTITVTNKRSSSARLYRVNSACQEVPIGTISPNVVLNVPLGRGERLTAYDDRWGGLLFDWTHNGVGAPSGQLAMHLFANGPCPTPTATAASVSINNARAAGLSVYDVGSSCGERLVGHVSPMGTATVSVLVGSQLRIYETTTDQLARVESISAPTQTVSVPVTPPNTTCAPAPTVATSIHISSTWDVPLRMVTVAADCSIDVVGELQEVGTALVTSLPVGATLDFVNVKTGERVLQHNVVAGLQQVRLVKPNTVSGNCSAASATNVNLKVKNNRVGTIRVTEVDETCAEIDRGEVLSGGQIDFVTPTLRRWRFYDRATNMLIRDETLEDVDSVIELILPQQASWTGTPVTNGTPTCQRTETSYSLAPFHSTAAMSGTMEQLLNPFDGVHDFGNGTRDEFAQSFFDGFRKWKPMCRIAASDVTRGTYSIVVRTNVKDESAGMNSYSLRARWIDPTGAQPPTSANLQLSAIENLSVMVNLGGTSTSSIYMSRIQPVYAGRRLRIELYDIGDTASGTVDVRLVPPADSNVVGGTWPCEISQHTGSGEVVPAFANPSTCAVTGLTRYQYNGTVVRMVVNIPPDYTCDPTVPKNCWTKIEMKFNGGQPTDKTTWSSGIEGDPLRIVK